LIVNTEGGTVGEHKGIAFYTIGQRKGIGCHKKPMYVVKIDGRDNVIIIGEEKELYRDELTAERVNWVGIEKLTKPLKVKARIRYRTKESEAVVSPLKRSLIEVKFSKPQRAITPGQAVVFYKRDVVVGGGWIV
jgi:tRNA-specific 2-thiouridylase